MAIPNLTPTCFTALEHSWILRAFTMSTLPRIVGILSFLSILLLFRVCSKRSITLGNAIVWIFCSEISKDHSKNKIFWCALQRFYFPYAPQKSLRTSTCNWLASRILAANALLSLKCRYTPCGSSVSSQFKAPFNRSALNTISCCGKDEQQERTALV